MPQPISEQALILSHNINQLVHCTQRLDEKYRSKIDKMSQKMTDFLTEYDFNSRLSIAEYASYLNHDALSPLTIVLGYAELFRTVHANQLTVDELSHTNLICEQIRILTESVRDECNLIVAQRDRYTATRT